MILHTKSPGQKSRKNFVGIFVQTMKPKGHFEINWPLVIVAKSNTLSLNFCNLYTVIVAKFIFRQLGCPHSHLRFELMRGFGEPKRAATFNPYVCSNCRLSWLRKTNCHHVRFSQISSKIFWADKTIKLMGYCPLVALCLPLADLHHFCLTKQFSKTPSAI